MNFKLYEVDYPYPTKGDIKALQFYTTKFPERFSPDIPHNLMVKEAHKILNGAEKLAMENFKLDAFDELGITDHPKRETLYRIAYEHSHGEGLQTIFDTMEELSELLV